MALAFKMVDSRGPPHMARDAESGAKLGCRETSTLARKNEIFESAFGTDTTYPSR